MDGTSTETGRVQGANADADHRGLVMGLGMAVSVMAAATSAAGLSYWNAGVAGASATSPRGENVALVGEGLYGFDTPFTAGTQLGTDLVILVLGVPLLLVATAMHRRGSRLGHVLVTGMLAVFGYVFGAMAFGAITYNALYPVYVVTFAAALWALVLTVSTVPVSTLPLDRVPRRAAAVVTIAGAGVIVAMGGTDLVAALVTGGVPGRLDVYAVPVIHTLDLAVVAPAAVAAGVLLLRGSPAGYAAAVPVLTLLAAFGPLVVTRTAGQLVAGARLTAAETVGPLAVFAVLSVAAGLVLATLLREVSRDPAGRPPAPGTG
ncbi:MAG: hypothetical protein ACFCVF_00470 [Kineosporiaceae bacterium]